MKIVNSLPSSSLHLLTLWAASFVSHENGLFTMATADNVVSIHGSGTNNPQNCYWNIMEEIASQAKQSVRMTYRAVGSGTGIKELIGNVTFPDNDFGSGELPLSTEQYQQLNDNGVEVLHFPVVMGAISFFHSVPTLPGHELNMTSCLLARIFRREIKDWNDEDIASINPNLDIPIVSLHSTLDIPQPFPIIVARRVLGSSNTAGITEYLHKSCPEHWPAEMVGGVVDWEETTIPCEGSAEMTRCIRDSPGTIGYIDSGYGHNERLHEVAIKNADGFTLTSKTSYSKGGILTAAEAAELPVTFDGDFSNVSLLNQPGRFTWPIAALTYIYVRKDLTKFIPDPRAQGLLIAFLKALYNEKYMAICEEQFGFVRVTGPVQDKALEGIKSLVTSSDAPEWIFEDETQARTGQGQYVISSRRKVYSEVEQDFLIEQVTRLENELIQLENTVAQLEAQQQQQQQGALDFNSNNNNEDGSARDFTGQDESRLNTALILSIVATSLWFVTMILLLLKMFLFGGKGK